MQYITFYNSPLGEILIACDDIGLTGLWFRNQKYFATSLSPEHINQKHPLLENAVCWLDKYFSGTNLLSMPPLHLTGTPFQLEVWELLCKIPYGQTATYKEIAAELAQKRNLISMSAQAVGGAVGKNPVSIIIPCHRVIGSNGNLTGYAGGLERKQALLSLENNFSNL